MNPLILIPARVASTRLPNKPLAMRAVASNIGDVVVACDSRAIADVVEAVGGVAVMTDPELPSGSDRIHAALGIIDPQGKYDVVLNVQGDMPLLDPTIIRASAKLLEDPAVDIGTLAAVIRDEQEKMDPAVVKKLDGAIAATHADPEFNAAIKKMIIKNAFTNQPMNAPVFN